MKKISKYIQLIIFLSSFALLGFLIIQLYWAKNNFDEKKQNIEQLYEICLQEIGNQLNDAVLNQSSIVDPNLNSGITTIKPLEKSYEKELSDKIYDGLINLKNNSLAEKREEILNIVNSHYSMNLTYNIEKVLRNKDIEEVIQESFAEFGIENESKYTITDQEGVLIFTNFEEIENKNLSNYSQFTIHFLEDEVSAQKSILTLYIKGLNKSISRSISGVFLISFALILIILSAFIISIKIIKGQKRTTQIKTDFINNMTHELKTPIATIGLACEALVDTNIDLDKTKKTSFLKTIQNENERLGKLVENVLENSLSDKGNPNLKLEIFNLEEIIFKAIKSIELSYNKKGGEIHTDFMAHNILVEADKLHITNVIYNLLDNSLKYTTKKPRVTISTRDIIGGLIIRIKDNGIGIAKENHNQVFEKLFRVPTGNVHNVKGFGLGLSYVKSIIDLHTGNIKIESKLNEGSTFLISLKSSKIIKNEDTT